MKISVEWRDSKFPTFSLMLASKEGAEPFLTIKDCRIVDGSKGKFVSWPAKKMDSGKYFSYCYASEAFQSAVMAAAEAAQPKQQPKKPQTSMNDDEDLPW